MAARGERRAGVVLLALLVWAAALGMAPPARAQSLPPKREPKFLREWLKGEHAKVQKDSERLLVLTRNLHYEAANHAHDLLPSEVIEQTRLLDEKARKLGEAVQGASEHFLSVPVVELSEEIRDDARGLRKSLDANPSKKQLTQMRQFVREIEQRADAIYKRTRLP